jgi:hypothetical protein
MRARICNHGTLPQMYYILKPLPVACFVELTNSYPGIFAKGVYMDVIFTCNSLKII